MPHLLPSACLPSSMQKSSQGSIKAAPTRRSFSLHGVNDSEETVLLILNTSREEQLVGLASASTVAEGQGPQLIEHEWLAVLVFKYAERCSRCRIKCVDAPITEIADQQIIAKATEIGWSQSYSPGQVQWAMANQAFDQVAIRIEDVHKAMPPAYFKILSSIQNVELAAYVLDVERSIPLWNAGVMKGPLQCGRRKMLIEYVDGASAEIGCKEQWTSAVASNGKASVDRSRLRVINRYDSLCAINSGIPTRDRAG